MDYCFFLTAVMACSNSGEGRAERSERLRLSFLQLGRTRRDELDPDFCLLKKLESQSDLESMLSTPSSL
jgi:hypothetical protein